MWTTCKIIFLIIKQHEKWHTRLSWEIKIFSTCKSINKILAPFLRDETWFRFGEDAFTNSKNLKAKWIQQINILNVLGEDSSNSIEVHSYWN